MITFDTGLRSLRMDPPQILVSDAELCELDLYRKGARLQLGGGDSVKITFKPASNIASGQELLVITLTSADYHGPSQTYRQEVDVRTSAMLAALAASTLSTQPPTAALIMDAQWIPASGPRAKSFGIPVTATQEVSTAGDGTPQAVDSPADWLAQNGVLSLPGVSDYTGGGSTKLDGFQATAGLSVPRWYQFYKSGLGMQQYMLRAGTDAPSSPGIIRPTDFDATTNQRVYEKQS